MRLSRVRGKRGGVAVLVMIAVPLLTAMLLLLIDVGRLAVARSRLQAAADRAAYAGAASLAHSLDRIAVANWDLFKAYRDLEEDFDRGDNQNRDAARERIRAYEASRDEALTTVEQTQSTMEERAESAAASTLAANARTSSETISASANPSLDAEADREAQWRMLTYSDITGTSYIDPESVEEESYEALRYLVKRRAPDAAVAVEATTEVRPLFLQAALGDALQVRAEADAQAFGGSAEDFALRETDTAEEAAAEIDDGGYDALYRATLIPDGNVNY
jgi:hypothetical protein